MTGRIANFTAQTESMAGMGKRDIGRGILKRAKEAPRSISAIGTAMLPTNLAVQD